MKEIEFSRWLFELPAKQHSQFRPSGSTFLPCLGLPSKSHRENSISSMLLESPHQVDMKNVVKCQKHFFGYFNALKTHGDFYVTHVLLYGSLVDRLARVVEIRFYLMSLKFKSSSFYTKQYTVSMSIVSKTAKKVQILICFVYENIKNYPQEQDTLAKLIIFSVTALTAKILDFIRQNCNSEGFCRNKTSVRFWEDFF